MWGPEDADTSIFMVSADKKSAGLQQMFVDVCMFMSGPRLTGSTSHSCCYM